MKAFIYKGRTYIRMSPGKRLFNSTTIWEVVNRGDVFAMDIETQVFTIVPGKSQVEHIEIHAMPSVATIAKELKQEQLELNPDDPS